MPEIPTALQKEEESFFSINKQLLQERLAANGYRVVNLAIDSQIDDSVPCTPFGKFNVGTDVVTIYPHAIIGSYQRLLSNKVRVLLSDKPVPTPPNNIPEGIREVYENLPRPRHLYASPHRMQRYVTTTIRKNSLENGDILPEAKDRIEQFVTKIIGTAMQRELAHTITHEYGHASTFQEVWQNYLNTMQQLLEEYEQNQENIQGTYRRQLKKNLTINAAILTPLVASALIFPHNILLALGVITQEGLMLGKAFRLDAQKAVALQNAYDAFQKDSMKLLSQNRRITEHTAQNMALNNYDDMSDAITIDMQKLRKILFPKELPSNEEAQEK